MAKKPTDPADSAEAAAAEPAAAAEAAATVKARVLTPSSWGAVDAVVTVTADEAAAGHAAGELDASPEAVAYAESLAV